MALTDTAVRHGKPRAKDYTLPDYNGLALFVNTKGAKCWHFRFPGWISNSVFLSVPILKLAYEMLVLCVMLRGHWSLGDPRVHRQLECNARRLATENA